LSNPRDTDPTGAEKPATGDLAARIAEAQARRAAQTVVRSNRVAEREATALGRGIRLGSEFAAAVLVGAGAGYLLDQWLHTSPWLLLILLLVGFAAGVLNVVRSAAEMNRAAPPPPASALTPGVDDDEDD
jgi:ATP synthase protein I